MPHIKWTARSNIGSENTEWFIEDHRQCFCRLWGGGEIDSWNWVGTKYGIELAMSFPHTQHMRTTILKSPFPSHGTDVYIINSTIGNHLHVVAKLLVKVCKKQYFRENICKTLTKVNLSLSLIQRRWNLSSKCELKGQFLWKYLVYKGVMADLFFYICFRENLAGVYVWLQSALMAPPEGHPGQLAYTFVICILSTSRT